MSQLVPPMSSEKTDGARPLGEDAAADHAAGEARQQQLRPARSRASPARR